MLHHNIILSLQARKEIKSLSQLRWCFEVSSLTSVAMFFPTFRDLKAHKKCHETICVCLFNSSD